MRPRFLRLVLFSAGVGLAAVSCGWPGGLAALNPTPRLSPAPMPSLTTAPHSLAPEVSEVRLERATDLALQWAMVPLLELEPRGVDLAAAPVTEVARVEPFQGLGGGVQLTVPFRTQKDGDRFQGANCGPAALSMALGAFGIERSNAELRWLTHTYQGTAGRGGGTALQHMATVGEDFGLTPIGLYADGEFHRPLGLANPPEFYRWTVADIVAEVEQGRIVVPLVKYRLLPGHEDSLVRADHFIVVHGVEGDSLLYHDPAFGYPEEGGAKWMTRAQLDRAMRPAMVARQAVAFASGRYPPLAPIQSW